MPYSFTQIEKEKSTTIYWVFLFLVGCYFVTAWLLYWVVKNYLFFENLRSGARLWELPSLSENIRIFAVASAVGIIHWWTSSSGLLVRMLDLLEAKTLNDKDPHHAMLQNIVDEVSVATGGKKSWPGSFPHPP